MSFYCRTESQPYFTAPCSIHDIPPQPPDVDLDTVEQCLSHLQLLLNKHEQNRKQETMNASYTSISNNNPDQPGTSNKNADQSATQVLPKYYITGSDDRPRGGQTMSVNSLGDMPIASSSRIPSERTNNNVSTIDQRKPLDESISDGSGTLHSKDNAATLSNHEMMVELTSKPNIPSKPKRVRRKTQTSPLLLNRVTATDDDDQTDELEDEMTYLSNQRVSKCAI